MALRTNLRLTEADGFIVGDSFALTVSVVAMPEGLTLTKAWWTIKAAATDPDPGDLQLVIDATEQATGQITNDGSEGTGALTFTATPVDTAALVADRSEEHTSELQSPCNLVCRLLLEKKK